ncbi:SDR family NAD(P)-dependent oxidoreductase [Aeromicrobium sp. UC242_57]|uniref:SDR family NAD(P)-dependent oxidoreductase n=1 Tax=Aeromicrobium sp. UC242_57 TaxID=3374624 RepID=UPI0037AD3025
MTWTTDDIPDLTGKRAVITGVTGGLGLHTAIGLARKGASLVVTARDSAKADESVRRITDDSPGTSVDVVSLDLADLADATRAASEVATTYDRIDILINNAGIMVPPKQQTRDGFEACRSAPTISGTSRGRRPCGRFSMPAMHGSCRSPRSPTTMPAAST